MIPHLGREEGRSAGSPGFGAEPARAWRGVSYNRWLGRGRWWSKVQAQMRRRYAEWPHKYRWHCRRTVRHRSGYRNWGSALGDQQAALLWRLHEVVLLESRGWVRRTAWHALVGNISIATSIAASLRCNYVGL